MRGWMKVGLLAAYLASFHESYWDRIETLGPGLILGLYLGVFVGLVAALFAGAWVRPGWLRWSWALAFATSAAFFDAYMAITHTYLTYSAFVSLVYSGGFVQEAVTQFHAPILGAVARALLVLIGIGLHPGRWPRLPPILPAVAPALGLCVLMGILFMRAGEGARGLPVMYTPLAYLGLFAYESLVDGVGPRQPVRLARSGPPVARKVVLIVDESVAGNYLDVNAQAGVTSHLAQAQPGVDIHNFGYAAAIANCSAETNVTLRYGGTRADYLRINSTQPSIWQYAKASGMGTVYIDAQRTGGYLQNLMTAQEKQDIDRFIQFDDIPVLQRDMAALDALMAQLADPTPQFIMINKVGAHFPVNDKYPDAFMTYRPVLPRGRFTDVADSGEREGFDGSSHAWTLYRNSYRNALSWSVGEFFRRMFASADLSQVVVIYTSDHGQDLHERGNPGLNTHCGSDPVAEEGLVPLLLIQGSQVESFDWRAHMAQNHDASSHYNIFPTLLRLMGYDRDSVTSLYGRSLDMATHDPFTFNVRFNARLGAEPDFRHIDLDQIMTPDKVVDMATATTP